MTRPRNPRPTGTESGFTMIEMLMAAFLLAVGILGLTMLQVVSLDIKGASQNLTTATQLGERIMDQVEEEGRNTWLNVSSSQQANPPQVPNLMYFAAGLPNLTQYFDISGNPLAGAAGSVFTATTTAVAVPNLGPTGLLADVTVTLAFGDVPVNGRTLVRKVVLTRRIIHA